MKRSTADAALSFPASTLESGILINLYDNPTIKPNTYNLAQALHPTIEMGTPPFVKLYENTRDAIEELIVQKLIRGTRLKGADGVFFGDIELTQEGERAAILTKREKAEFEKELPKLVERTREFDKETQGHETKE
jgi:hypothetical protein